MNNSELEIEYEAIAPLCDQFGREITRQLEELLSEENISLGFPLQYRVKKFDSVMQKVERASSGSQHVQDLNDLIGLRIILLFKRDVETVRALIKKNLKVLSEEDTQTRLGESEFGYSSVHFQVGLKPGWKKMPTFKKAGALRAEIQVRTVAQHIWAAASHSLQYKQEQSVPPLVRRVIHRVSALLETVDLEFERVLLERSSYKTEANTKSASETLNVDLLNKILDEKLPTQNLAKQENYADLLEDLFYFSIKTPKQLIDLLNEQNNAIIESDKTKVTMYKGFTFPDQENIQRVARGVFFTHIGLVREALTFKFKDRWKEYSNKKWVEGKNRKISK